MRIVADRAIPFIEEACASFGEVAALPANEITAARAAEADVLFVRSVTRVDERLLCGSPVQFVGTATIGVDHIDADYLRSCGIGFASAAGSNARSVSEYVAAGLFHLAATRRFTLRGLTLGVVGVGNIGRLVTAWGETIGLRVLRCDPPRARTGTEGDAAFVPFETILTEADVITFHVPLVRGGPDATYHYLKEENIGRLKPGCILFNTSRGAVIDSVALLAALQPGRLGPVVLDVWEHEPAVSPQLIDRVSLGTAHIAGYSYDGKLAGTKIVQHAAVAQLGIGTPWDPAPHLSTSDGPARAVRIERRVRHELSETDEQVITRIITAAYDIRKDDEDLRHAVRKLTREQRGAAFESLRANYPRRREFPHTRLQLDDSTRELGPALSALGFSL